MHHLGGILYGYLVWMIHPSRGCSQGSTAIPLHPSPSLSIPRGFTHTGGRGDAALEPARCVECQEEGGVGTDGD